MTSILIVISLVLASFTLFISYKYKKRVSNIEQAYLKCKESLDDLGEYVSYLESITVSLNNGKQEVEFQSEEESVGC
jgi:hypothetical protein